MKTVRDISIEASAPVVPKQLVVGTVPHDFSPATHRALGPWCFFKTEHVYPDWDQLPFVDPFATNEARHAGGRAMNAMTEILVEELYSEMNRRHGTQYSREFWRCVLGDWLMYLVTLSWKIWRYVETFVEASGQEPFHVASMDVASPFRFADTQDFINCCTYHSEFRTWLTHEAVRRLVPKHWVVETSERLTPTNAPLPVVPRRRRWPVDRLDNKVFYGSRFAKLWQLVFSLYVHVLPKRPTRVTKRPVPPQPAEMSAAYLSLLRELLSVTMPESLRERFAALDAEARRHRYRKGRLYVLSINPHDDLGNLILGHATAAGERVIDLQHGGVYGWSEIDWGHATNEYHHDTFASWGFTRHGNYPGNFFPLPSPMLSSLARAPRGRSGEIVMVGAFMYSVPPRFDCFPPMMKYRQAKPRFLNGLSREAFERLRYRQYPSPHTYSDFDWLRERFPKLTAVDVSGPFIEVLSRASLVVLDHPQTAVCQVMAGDFPTVAFWDWNAWPLTPQATPLFEELERVGILFRTPEAAAAQVNKVWKNARAWWDEPERQRVRLAWCDQFALHDEHCWLTWLKRMPSI